ncbi:MAG TPA: hypothetical protein VE710_14265 [Candidatus Bathyarchaeia archaeon]|uniref:hypothetical protein n=1 Tax=Brevibacillus migulae TaxID=1644114 RepID=UPI001430E240|nr:hypothetical protein [Brevibacillus migulae]HZG16164.1 hypothetical protein [Candidatus Bathyarchaeia archaeon]
MTKLFSVFLCIIFTLGIIVASMSKINDAIVKDNGLRDKSVSWIDQAIPTLQENETE